MVELAVFVGREHYLRELTDLAARAAAGDGGVRWIVGDAGMGKTAVLGELVERIDPDTRVLSATGREGETELAWGVFEQLVAPLVTEELDTRLPAPQRSAVRSALALETSPASTDHLPLATAMAGRNLLLLAAATRPLLVLLDDWHWVDEPSRRALDYVLARLEGTPITVIVAGRRGDGAEPPVEALPLDPLDRDASLALLRERGVQDREVGERILDQLGGNPLLLGAAASELDEPQRAGRAPLPEVLPVPASVVRLAEKHLVDLDTSTRDAVLIAAVAPRGDLRTVNLALRVLGRDGHPLERAEAAGIIRLDEAHVAFTHPTLRSAAYHTASAGDRRRAHGAVAETLTDEVVRAWHAGQAAVGPDDGVADDLTRAADTLLGRRAPVAAAGSFERAAALTTDPEAAGVRLRRAAEALAETGRTEAALALLDQADDLGRLELEAARREQLRLRLAARGGATEEAIEGLRSLAARVQALDPLLSAQVWLDALPALVGAARGNDIEQVAKSALEQADRAGSPNLARRAEVALGGLRLARGDLDGQAMLDRYAEVLEVEGALASAPFLAEVVAPYLGLLRRGPEVEALFDTLERDLRQAVAIPSLIAVLSARSLLSRGRDLRRSAADNVEAIELAEAIDQPELALLAAASLSVTAGVMGDDERVALAAGRCARATSSAHQAGGLAGRAALHLGRGELDEALAIYELMCERFGIGSSMVRWEPDWCEALVRTRHRERAAETIEEFAGSPMGPLTTGGICRVRGMVATDDDAAAAQFRRALRFVDIIPNDVVRGRTELVWGERLRRSRKRAEARTHLETAVTLLRRVGADPWADRAERELVAAGAAPAMQQGTADALTGRERDVVRLAAEGATNRVIAEQLYVSPRTVETHLGSIYRKLGVANRRELIHWVSKGGGPDN